MQRSSGIRFAVALGALLVFPLRAHADVELKFGGQIASDIRYRLGGEEIPAGLTQPFFPSQQRLLRYGFSRNENLIKAQLTLSIGERVKAVADVDFVWYGYSDVNDLDSDTLHERVDPYRLEAHAAYLDVYKILPHLDLRIGRQVVSWGTADKFNPTSNLNTLDLSDPLLFGKALANNMIRVDYNPISDLIITAVWVPIFRPAQLPRTAPLALTDPSRPPPVQEPGILQILQNLQAANPPTSVNVVTQQPDPSIQNSQVGVRIGMRLPQKVGGQDVSLSYYHGRFGIPSPSFTANGASGLVTAYVMWPRMDVVGADLAGSLEKLGGIGYWAEGALFFPQAVSYGLYNDDPSTAVSRNPSHDPLTFEKDAAGHYTLKQTYPEAQRATVVPSTPFWKLTLGFDKFWTKALYTNIQYVHGFIDEFGAGVQRYAAASGAVRAEQRIGEYLVAGADYKLFNDVLLLRFFGAFKVPSVGDENPKFTAVLFPQVAWAVWDATELSFGAFIFLGDRDTKFGDPAAGASEIFAKAKFTY